MNNMAIILPAVAVGVSVLVRLLVEYYCRPRLTSGRAWMALLSGQLVAALMVELARRDHAAFDPWLVLVKALQNMAFQLTLWRVTRQLESIEGTVLGCLAAAASHRITGKVLGSMLRV